MGSLKDLFDFLMGKRALQQAAGQQTSPPGVMPNVQAAPSQIFTDESQNNGQVNQAVQAYMQNLAKQQGKAPRGFVGPVQHAPAPAKSQPQSFMDLMKNWLSK